jgi:hypothetical protein
MVWPQRSRVFAGARFRSTRRGLLLLAPCFLVGCYDIPQVKPKESTVLDIATALTYFRDARTNQCFAASAQRDYGDQGAHTQITWVPCSAAVLAIAVGVEKSQVPQAAKQSEAKP